MVRRTLLPLVAAPLLLACEEREAHPVFAELTIDEVTIPEAMPGVPPQFAQFRIRNSGASTLYISAAPSLARSETPELDDEDIQDILLVDLPSFTQVNPQVTFPIEVTLDERPWLWKTGSFTAVIPFEVRYFFSGQAPDQPETPSSSAPPTSITDFRDLTVNFSINCDADNDGFDSTACGGIDCDDTRASVHPDAEEVCDSLDNDCTGAIDDWATDRDVYYLDDDLDGFGDPDTRELACAPPSNKHIERAGDCDDTNNLIDPNEREVCNDDIDNDCNGDIDEEDSFCQ